MQPQSMPMQMNGQMPMQQQMNGQQFHQQQMSGFRQQIPAGARPQQPQQQPAFMPPQVLDPRFPRNMQPTPMPGMARMANPAMGGMPEMMGQNPNMMGQMMPKMPRMASNVPGLQPNPNPREQMMRGQVPMNVTRPAGMNMSAFGNAMPNQGQPMNVMSQGNAMMNQSNMMNMRTVAMQPQMSPQKMTMAERNNMMMTQNQHPLQSKQMRYQSPHPSQFQQNLPMGGQNFQMGANNFQNIPRTQSFPQMTTQPSAMSPAGTRPQQNFANPTTPQGYQNPTTPGTYQSPTTPLSQQNPLTPQSYQNPPTPVSYQNPSTPGSYQNPTTPLSVSHNPMTPQGYQNPPSVPTYQNPSTPGASYHNPGTPNSYPNPPSVGQQVQNPATPHSTHNPSTPQQSCPPSPYAHPNPKSPYPQNPRTPQSQANPHIPPSPHSSIGLNGIKSPMPGPVSVPNTTNTSQFTPPIKTEPVIKTEPSDSIAPQNSMEMETSSTPAMPEPPRRTISPAKNNVSPVKLEVKQEIKEEKPETPEPEPEPPKVETPEPPPKTPEPYIARDPEWGVESEMPERALKKIFLFVCSTDGCIPFLAQASTVCKYWNKVSQDKSLWVKANLGSCAIKEKSKNDKKIEHILEKKFTNALSVDLCGWHNVVSSTTLKIVANACPTITHLGLANCEKLNNEDVRIIPSLFPNLNSVDLSRVSPSSASSRSAASSNALSDLIAGMGEKLVTFIMAGNKMAGLPYVFNALSKHSKNLRLLDVSNISTTSRDPIIVNIEKLQKGCPLLTVLRTTNTMLTLNESAVRDHVKSPGFPHMEQLTIGVDNKGYFDGMDDAQIERILKSSKNLKLLDIRGCKGINDSTLVRLPAWDVEFLYVAGCSVTSSSSDGLELLVKKWGRTLKELDIGFTHKQRTVDWALLAFVEDVEDDFKPQLRKLDLMGSNVGLKPLTKLLDCCKYLESLNLMDCASLPRGMKRLYPTLEDVQRLKKRIPSGNFDGNDSDDEF